MPNTYDLAGKHIHARPEQRHEEVVQHVVRAHQHLDRVPRKQVDFVGVDEQVVLRPEVGRVETERGFARDEPHPG